MKKKIAEFDSHGVDLSKTCQHKTVPGGIFSIIIIAYSLYTIMNNIFNYLWGSNVIETRHLIDFDLTMPSFNITSLNMNGSISFTDNINFPISNIFQYFKLAFEYNLDSSYTSSSIYILDCKAENNQKCIFNLPLKTEYFHHSYYIHHKPRIILQSCRKLKSYKNIIIENPESLDNCVNDSEMENIYSNEELLKQNISFTLGVPDFQILNNGTVFRFHKENKLLFRILKPNSVSYFRDNSYIMEAEKMVILYNNKLLSFKSENYTYINFQNPKMSLIEIEENEDFFLNMIFSFRLDNEVLLYYVTRTTVYDTVVSIAGFLGLIGLFSSLHNLWNSYYIQKVLFQIHDLYRSKNPVKEGEEEEEKLNIDWENLGYCKWYWLTCCCNPDKRKKIIKRKIKELLNEYQCKSCIKVKGQHKWFDLSRIIKDENNEGTLEADLGDNNILINEPEIKGIKTE